MLSSVNPLDLVQENTTSTVKPSSAQPDPIHSALAVIHSEKTKPEACVDPTCIVFKRPDPTDPELVSEAPEGGNGVVVTPPRVNPNTPVNGEFPIFAAIRNRDHRAIEELVIAGACLDVLDGNGDSPITAVLKREDMGKEDVEIIKTLLRLGADPCKVDGDGYSAFHVAALYGEIDVLEMILDKPGVDINYVLEGETPLRVAILADQVSTCAFLLDRGADPNLKRRDNHHTPLHRAAQCGNREIVELLLQKGADKLALTKTERTPAELAMAQDNPECAEALHGQEYVAEFSRRKFLAHAFPRATNKMAQEKTDRTYAGDGTIHLEGYTASKTHPKIGDILSAFYGESASVEEKAVIDSFRNAASSLSPEELAAKIQKGELVIMSAGWDEHNVDVVFYGGFMAVCNRGEGSYKGSIIIHRINPNLIKAKYIEDIRELSSEGSMVLGSSFLYNRLPVKLGGTKVDIPDDFAPSPGKAGTCTWNAGMAAYRAVLFLHDLAHHGTVKPESVEQAKTLALFAKIYLAREYLEPRISHPESRAYTDTTLVRESWNELKQKTADPKRRPDLLERVQKMEEEFESVLGPILTAPVGS